MTTQEAVVAVLGAAIVANIVLAVGLIIWPGIRARRDGGGATRPATRADAGTGMGVGAAFRPMPVGPGNPYTPRSIPGPPDPARPGAWLEAVGPGVIEPAKVGATDPITGLELAPAWSKWLSEEAARIGRYGRPATIVLVEVAGIDRLAERLGPDAVDRLIPPIATTMRRHARAADNIARLGRARFGALLPETDEIRAINYVERTRSECDVWLEAGAVALRLTIGWAEIAANQPVAVAIQAAERRLNAERARLRGAGDIDVDASEPGAEPENKPEPEA